MSGLCVWTLATGIGALDLGLERAGMTIVGQCEIDPWCRSVLDRHWPGLPRWADLKEVDPADVLSRCGPVDVVAGGPPCQPISNAGKGLAQADPRWLWPHVVRLVAGLRPRYVLLENPTALLGRGFGDVVGYLAEIGYDAEWTCIAAADVGAPHRRDRVWIVAYPARDRAGRTRVGAEPGRPGDGGVERQPAVGAQGGYLADAGSGGRGAVERDLCAGQRDAARRGAVADARGAGPGPHARGAHAHEGADEGWPSADDHVADGDGQGSGRRPLADAQSQRRAEGRAALPRRERESAPAGSGEPLADPDGQGRPRHAQHQAAGARQAAPGHVRELPQPVLGGVLDGPAAGLDLDRWPAPPGQPQHEWEPPRTVRPREVPDRGRRVSACGNALLPQVAELIGLAILDHARGAA